MAGVFHRVAAVEMVRISTQAPSGLNTSSEDLTPTPPVIYLVDGRPATLACTVLGGYPQPSLRLVVDDRVLPTSPATTATSSVCDVITVTSPATTVSTASAAILRPGSRRGLRVVTVTSWRWTLDYRPRPSDDGALIKCLAAVPGRTAVASTAQLHVDCQYLSILICILICIYLIYNHLIYNHSLMSKTKIICLSWNRLSFVFARCRHRTDRLAAVRVLAAGSTQNIPPVNPSFCSTHATDGTNATHTLTTPLVLRFVPCIACASCVHALDEN